MTSGPSLSCRAPSWSACSTDPPANGHSTERVGDEADVGHPGPCRDVGQVGDPQLVGGFVDEVVPALQERGIYPTEYSGATLRENLKVPAQYGTDPRTNGGESI
jgi:hypothetical protein